MTMVIKPPLAGAGGDVGIEVNVQFRRFTFTNQLICEAKSLHDTEDTEENRLVVRRYIERRFREKFRTQDLRLCDAVSIKEAVIAQVFAPTQAEIDGRMLNRTRAFVGRRRAMRRASSAWSIPSLSSLVSVATGVESVSTLFGGESDATFK
jgi:hypothetical protein